MAQPSLAQPSFVSVSGVRFDLDVLDAFRRAIYDGFDYVREIEPAMWTEILRIMNEAAVEGISASRTGYNPHDEDFYRALRHSNEVFSTFKVHNFQQEMAAKLFDGKRLRSFDEWTKATMGIASHQVGSWLETEYNTAVIRAHQAADWQEFVRNKDILPNLRWMPTTSPEPDDKHKHYWMSRLTLPVDDPFWNEHYPGDRWNCKCSLEATDDPVHRPADIPEDKPQRGLDTNAGKTGEMFSQSHPYFPKDCAHCFAKRAVNGIATNSATASSRPWLAVAVHEASASAFSRLRSFFNAGGKKDCFNCPFIDECAYGTSKDDIRDIVKDARKTLQGSALSHPALSGDIHVSLNGIKEWTNQPHKHFAVKNRMLLAIDSVLPASIYKGRGLDKSTKPGAMYIHLFETEIAGDKSWIIVKEYSDGNKFLYSVSDSSNILKALK